MERAAGLLPRLLQDREEHRLTILTKEDAALLVRLVDFAGDLEISSIVQGAVMLATFMPK